MEKDLAILRSQQLPSGLFVAGAGDYDKIWIRDNAYVALAFTEAGHLAEAAQIYAGLFAILKRYEHVLDQGVYPVDDADLLHPRFTLDGGIVTTQRWSNKQHDAVGALLYGVGYLYAIDQKYLTAVEKELCQKLIYYLETCRYWEDEDNGMWEEGLSQHASSLAACIKGIEAVSGFCDYDSEGLTKAKSNLSNLLPRESLTHEVDMALLSVVWPYGYQRRDIVEKVENLLLREKGVIRYPGDVYEASGGTEPQWVMGIPWLGIAHHALGDTQKAAYYLSLTEELYTESGLPESYIANNEACIHTPLAWSHAMAIVLRARLNHT